MTEPVGTNETSAGLVETRGNGAAERLAFDPSVFDQETPDDLIPKMDQYPVDNPVYYAQLFIRDAKSGTPGKPNPITEPLDPFKPLEDLPPPGEPLEGVLLTFEQAWREKGLALGRLLHSLCLAPGEVTRIAVMDFHRREAGRSAEEAAQDEGVRSDTHQDSAVQETQKAVARESQSGGSVTSSLASQSQMGVSGGGLFVSGSASTALSMGIGVTASTSASSSNLAAEAARRMQQGTVAASQATRSRRATQVREVDESESQTATARVIANYNHMHALTMMFFEVIQLFELSTRVVAAERVVFLPMEPADVDDMLKKHPDLLQQIATDLGLDELRDALILLRATDPLQLQQRFNEAKETFEYVFREYAAGSVDLDNPQDPRMARPRYTWMYQHWLPAMESAVARIVIAGAADPNHPQYATYVDLQRRLDAVTPRWQEYNAARVAWESYAQKVALVQAHAMLFSHAMWMRLDPAKVQRLVRGKTFKGKTRNVEPLDGLMDPRPLGVYGNFVAFRLPHADKDGDLNFAKDYVHKENDPSVPQGYIAMPSGGVFGEAVLGRAVSAEKIDLTRFWNWKDSPIPILPPDMQPLSLASRARGMEFSRVDLDAAITEILKPVVPEGVDLGPIVAKVKDTFRDMSGGDRVQAVLAAQIAAAQAGAKTAGDQSLQAQKNIQDFAMKLVDSDLAKTAFASFMPEGEAATVLGGILGGTKDKAAAPGGGSAPAGDSKSGPLGGGKSGPIGAKSP